MCMTWVLLGGVAWAACSLPLACLLGRGLRLADEREATGHPLVPDYVPDDLLVAAPPR